MEKENIIKYYKLIKEYFLIQMKNIVILWIFWRNLAFLDSNIKTKFEFDLWTYSNKFSFKGNITKLIAEDKLDKYVFFTNNATESFNNLINSCLSNNSKTSFTKFEEIIKFIFIRLEENLKMNTKIKDMKKRLSFQTF